MMFQGWKTTSATRVTFDKSSRRGEQMHASRTDDSAAGRLDPSLLMFRYTTIAITVTATANFLLPRLYMQPTANIFTIMYDFWRGYCYERGFMNHDGKIEQIEAASLMFSQCESIL